MRMSLTKVLAAVVLAVIVLLVIAQFGPSVLGGRAPAVSDAGHPGSSALPGR
jgi:hypothetical protein